MWRISFDCHAHLRRNSLTLFTAVWQVILGHLKPEHMWGGERTGFGGARMWIYTARSVYAVMNTTRAELPLNKVICVRWY